MSVHIQTELYNQLVHYCRNSLPFEACGLITGKLTPLTIDAVSLIPLRNHASNPLQHFQINPPEIIPYLMDTTIQIVGIFHSHPTAPPTPSEEDLATLWHTIPSHWILSLHDPNQVDLQIYHIKKATPTQIRKLTFVIGQ
ncbi:M67 family metallopeptidase [Paenibacillus sp. SI8]|uniref:M67 family metallopeptidase n=1 Tax=unclassified Paenibacillus TaxID=185978 RepID=UPI003467D698